MAWRHKEKGLVRVGWVCEKQEGWLCAQQVVSTGEEAPGEEHAGEEE